MPRIIVTTAHGERVHYEADKYLGHADGDLSIMKGTDRIALHARGQWSHAILQGGENR